MYREETEMGKGVSNGHFGPFWFSQSRKDQQEMRVQHTRAFEIVSFLGLCRPSRQDLEERIGEDLAKLISVSLQNGRTWSARIIKENRVTKKEKKRRRKQNQYLKSLRALEYQMEGLSIA
jgi:hypothetical protein